MLLKLTAFLHSLGNLMKQLPDRTFHNLKVPKMALLKNKEFVVLRFCGWKIVRHSVGFERVPLIYTYYLSCTGDIQISFHTCWLPTRIYFIQDTLGRLSWLLLPFPNKRRATVVYIHKSAAGK